MSIRQIIPTYYLPDPILVLRPFTCRVCRASLVMTSCYHKFTCLLLLITVSVGEEKQTETQEECNRLRMEIRRGKSQFRHKYKDLDDLVPSKRYVREVIWYSDFDNLNANEACQTESNHDHVCLTNFNTKRNAIQALLKQFAQDTNALRVSKKAFKKLCQAKLKQRAKATKTKGKKKKKKRAKDKSKPKN